MEPPSSLPLNGEKEYDHSDDKYLPKHRYSLMASTSILVAFAMSLVYFASGQVAWMQASTASAQQQHLPKQSPPITYGHVHVAKTGGTTLNRKMALRFEHVCGHKGYSYDAVQADVRWHSHVYHKDPEHYDIYSRHEEHFGPFSRDRVPPEIMDEIGYEDCDWISAEDTWRFWRKFKNWHFPVELHVPCRDPIDLLLSQCNHQGVQFNCEAEDIEQEIKTCDMNGNNQSRYNRFSYELQKDFVTKCFDYSQFDGYMKFMEQHLITRRVTVDYKFRRNGIPKRNKENECLLNNPELIEKVHSYLKETSEYYAFCNECMGSSDDLLVGIE